MFCKVHHDVNHAILRSIYHAIFFSNDWGQSVKYNHRVSILQIVQWKLESILFFWVLQIFLAIFHQNLMPSQNPIDATHQKLSIFRKLRKFIIVPFSI